MSTEIKKVHEAKANPLGYVVVAAVLLAIIFVYYLPAMKKVPLNSTEDIHIYYLGEKVDSALLNEEQLYLPLSFIKSKIDPNIQWDEQGQRVIITTPNEVYHLPLGKREGMLNLEPYPFSYPVVKNQGNIYLPAEPLDEYYQLNIQYLQEQSVAIIHNFQVPLTEGTVLTAGKLRQNPADRSPWLEEISQGENVYIMREENGHYWVETISGQMGYLDKKMVRLTGIKTAEIAREYYQPWNPLGEKIIMTWEGAWGKTVDPKNLPNLSGLHVVSPTWFSLEKDGLVKNQGDVRYVQWAHETGRQVWGLFDNSFDKDLTHQFLSSPELRIKVIKQLLTYVDLYQLDGINLDFENMYLKDKEGYVQFVRELAPLLHEKDRSISVNVTFISRSENWSMCYDRQSLGEIVDYVTVMAYDEHGTFSNYPGSVASLPWVEEGLRQILKEIPNEKIILGVPFYTRLWEESTDEKGNRKLTSKAISMTRAEAWVKENKLQPIQDPLTGQNYVELEKDGVKYSIWLEDEFSMEQRINLMKKYHLAGISGWRRGFEREGFWPVITDFINKR